MKWAEALKWFKALFEARNADYQQSPGLCVCEEGVEDKFNSYCKWFYDAPAQLQCTSREVSTPTDCEVCIEKAGVIRQNTIEPAYWCSSCALETHD